MAQFCHYIYSIMPFILILAMSNIPTVLSLECYQCDSNVDLECSELFDSDHTELKAHSCASVYEAKFCIKTTGMYGGRIGTIRNCSSRDLGNYCTYISRPGDERHIRSCIYTCSSGGCNVAHSNRIYLFNVASFVIVSALFCFNYFTRLRYCY